MTGKGVLFLKEVTGLRSTTAFVNSYTSYSITKPFWKAGGKASPRKSLHSPPCSAILPHSLLLLNPMLYDPILLLISNLLPLSSALELVRFLTDLFPSPKSAGKSSQENNLHTHTLFYLPTRSVSCTDSQRGVLNAKLMQWSAQSMWAVNKGGVCVWRQQMQC